MEKIICFVVGLPGSGKTKYLDQLRKSGFLTINDPQDFDRDILPFLKDDEQVMAIADYKLCFPSQREKTVIGIRTALQNIIFRWIYFENDPIQCLFNLRATGVRFGREANENLIWQVSQGYSIPANIETKPVLRLDDGTAQTRLSYAPASTSSNMYRLVRVMDDLVVFSAQDWESFRPTAWYILQKYPAHRYMIVEEMVTRTVTEILFDRMIS